MDEEDDEDEDEDEDNDEEEDDLEGNHHIARMMPIGAALGSDM